MIKPESKEAQEAAREAYKQAYKEAAELIEEIRGKDVRSHGDHYAGLWAAFKLSQKYTPWDEYEEAMEDASLVATISRKLQELHSYVYRLEAAVEAARKYHKATEELAGKVIPLNLVGVYYEEQYELAEEVLDRAFSDLEAFSDLDNESKS